MANDSRLQQMRDEPSFGQRSPGARPAEDPLAELARLIGQEDPFADFFQGGPPVAAPAASAPVREVRPQPAPPRPAPVARQPVPFTRRVPVEDEPVRERPVEADARPLRGEPRPAERVSSLQDAARDLNRNTLHPDRAPAAPAGRAPERITAERTPIAPPAGRMPVDRPLRAPMPVEPPAFSRGAEAVAEALFQTPAPAPVRPVPTPRPVVRQREPEFDAESFDETELRAGTAPAAERYPAGRQPVAPSRPAAPEALTPEARGKRDDVLDVDVADYDYSRTAAVEDEAYEDENFDPDEEFEDFEDEPRPSNLRRTFMLVAAFLGLVALIIAGIYGYRFFSGGSSTVANSGPAPVIRADQGPNKVVPPQSETTDQATADGQKLIYDRVGDAAVSGKEKVVSREEQPVDPSQVAQPQQPRVILPPTSGAAPSPSSPAPLGAMPSVGGPSASANSAEPKRVRTLQVRADGTIVAPSAGTDVAAAPPMPTDAPANSYAPAPSAAAPANVPLPTARTAAPAAAPSTTASVSPTAAAPAAAAAGYVVQVAAQRSEAEAQTAWKQVQARYPSVLGSQRASIRRADLGDRGIYFRAQVGPFASRDQANELCQSLRAQGGECMVQRN